MTTNTTTTMNINFYNANITEELQAQFNSAITHENALMNIQLLNDSIAKLEKKIENKDNTYTEEEVSAFQSELDKLVTSREKFEKTSDDTLEVYTKVVDTMTIKNENHFGNSKDNVRTVLRVLASLSDSNLMKLAIIPRFESHELYDCLETIHINSMCGEDGQLSMTKAVKDAYKEANAHLDTIMKETFSLPFETPYTEKMRVKLTAEDRKLLHDCYIKGFKNTFSVDEKTGMVDFVNREVNTLVKAKKNRKTGEVTYNYSGLATTIASIVIKHYFA